MTHYCPHTLFSHPSVCEPLDVSPSAPASPYEKGQGTAVLPQARVHCGQPDQANPTLQEKKHISTLHRVTAEVAPTIRFLPQLPVSGLCRTVEDHMTSVVLVFYMVQVQI